jgi:hypothetical protein
MLFWPEDTQAEIMREQQWGCPGRQGRLGSQAAEPGWCDLSSVSVEDPSLSLHG